MQPALRTTLRPSLIFILALLGCARAPEAPAPSTRPTTQAGVVDLLAMGDWGNNGARQQVVAKTMGDFIGKLGRPIQAMLLAGDNFYVKLSGPDDPQIQQAFERMYDPARFNFPFYASLGNHDYENNKAQIELDYARQNPSSRWKFPSKWYRVDFPQGDPLVSVLMLDSNRPLLGDAQWNEELEWLRTELAKPRTARWLVCCAHHPLFSNGDHGDNGVLQQTWGPLFEQAKVDFYVAGHDHDLQHLEVPDHSTSFVMVGGGGQAIRPMRVDNRGPFSKSLYGFGHFTFTPQTATVELINGQSGEVVHRFERGAGGAITVLGGGLSDTAIPRTPKSINRPDVDDKKD